VAKQRANTKLGHIRMNYAITGIDVHSAQVTDTFHQTRDLAFAAAETVETL